MKQKKAALELSIGTIVIIVIAMSMLILGLVLVRTIFTGSTESIDILNEKVQNEISSLFADEGADVIVKLGEGQTAKVKADGEIFGVAIGARTLDGSATTRERLQYKLTLEGPNGNNCASVLGSLIKAEELLVTPVNTFHNFDQFQSSNAFALVEVRVPQGTAICSQKVLVDVRDTQTGGDVGGNFFKIEVLRDGFFN